MNSSEANDVTIAEVTEYVSKLLLLDREWVVERVDGFDWFGSELCHSVDVLDEGRYSEGGQEKWIKLRSRSIILETDEATGLSLAASLNDDFTLGAFVYLDGSLIVQSTFIFNALGRSLLRHFAIQVLAQATVAKLIRDEYESDPRFSMISAAHPELGIRTEPDDILGVYRQPVATIEVHPDFVERVDAVRTGPLREHLLKEWQEGFNDVDVNFYQSHLVAFGIGVLQENAEFERFGPGIMVNTMSMRRLLDFDLSDCNTVNLMLGEMEMVSHFGPVRLPPNETDSPLASSSLVAQLPYASLAHLVNNPQGMMVQMLNFAMHASAAMTALEHYFESAESDG